MKDKQIKILLVIVCILLMINLFQIGNFKIEVRNKYSQLSNSVSTVRSEMSNITSNVSRTLEQEASIIAKKDFSFGDADMETLSVVLNVYVTPKEYSDTKTTGTLYIGDKAYKMIKKDGAFVMSEPVSMFEICDDMTVVFKDGDTVRSEELGWSMEPRYEALIVTYGRYEGSWRGTCDVAKKVYMASFDGRMSLECIGNSDLSYMKKAELAYFIDGKQIKSEKLDIGKNERDGSDFLTSYDIKETVNIPYGSALEICTIVTDNIGLKHVNTLERIVVDSDGALSNDDDEWEWRGSEDTIYDADGNCLYSPYAYDGIS